MRVYFMRKPDKMGESMPRSDTLKKLAAAHGMTIETYLDELAKRSR